MEIEFPDIDVRTKKRKKCSKHHLTVGDKLIAAILVVWFLFDITVVFVRGFK